LLKYIEENEKHVEISGYRNVKIEDFPEFLNTIHEEKQLDVEIQFFDAQLVATWQHLYFAVLNALTAFKNKENISKNLEMEIMLYASAQRQIQKAIELIGVKQHSRSIAVVIVGEKTESVKKASRTVSKYVNGERDDRVLELSKEKTKIIREAFEISLIEIKTVLKGNDFEQALTNLVIERMALLSTQR
jgi:KEOPS complex subunit Cgi121